MIASIRCILLVFVMAASAQGRTFTDTKGRSLDAEIVLYEGGETVEIRRADGQTFILPLVNLSPADQAYIRSWKPASIAEVDISDIEWMNTLLGIPLFEDGNLWDDDPSGVAERLGWPEESQTNTQSSYRKYNRPDDRILGARPYSSALYGRDGRVDMLSIVFANKGDSAGDTFAMNERDIEKAVREAVDQDGDTIATKLALLGESEQLTTATGRGMKERLQLWTWRGHIIALAVQDEEYITVRIISPDLAANRGRPERVASSQIRGQAQANVTRRTNEDVIIDNIPMVNQGPKGYCVPATLERILRYMDVRADMYLLAMAGQTQIGGGTHVQELVEGTERYVKSAGREMEPARIKMRVRDVAKYIDQGQPILWSLYSTDEFNSIASQLTHARANIENANEWKQVLNGQLKSIPELKPDLERGHVCLIIGYNATTDEIAVSDSWGPLYSERWVPAEVAAQVSKGGCWVVDF